MTIEFFLKLNLLSFFRNPLTDDQQLFIDRTNKVLKILRRLSDKAMELVAYNLIRPAEQWYETFLEGRNASGLPPFTWEEFTKVFMMRFLKREKYVADFERLKQIPGMSVAEYKEQFTKLSRYAHHLMSIETMRVRRFVHGLADPLFSNLLSMVGRMSYVEIMDAAYGHEIEREEQKVSKESGKKQMKGSFSGGAQSYQGRRQASSIGANSVRPASMSASPSGSQVGSVSQPDLQGSEQLTPPGN